MASIESFFPPVMCVTGAVTISMPYRLDKTLKAAFCGSQKLSLPLLGLTQKKSAPYFTLIFRSSWDTYCCLAFTTIPGYFIGVEHKANAFSYPENLLNNVLHFLNPPELLEPNGGEVLVY